MELNICINLDKSYILPAIVTVESIISISSSQKHKFFLHIIHSENRTENLQLLINFIKSKKISYKLYKVNLLHLEGAMISNHISKATYFRLLIAELLPKNLKKVLFIDCDLLVLKDITELFENDIENYEVAVVEENLGPEHSLRLGIPETDFHFNAGVIMINLENWRSNGLTLKLLNCLKSNSDKIIFWDQDVLNMVIKSKFKLPDKWNVTENVFKKELQISINEIGIIHYTGTCKPWNCSKHPFFHLFFEYLSKDYSWYKIRAYFDFLFKNLNWSNIKFHHRLKVMIGIVIVLIKPRRHDIYFRIRKKYFS